MIRTLQELIPGCHAQEGFVVADVVWLADGARMEVAWRRKTLPGEPLAPVTRRTCGLFDEQITVSHIPGSRQGTWVLGRQPATYEAVYLPQEVLKHPRWRWPPQDIGLRAPGAYPDFTDGLMLGWLQALVREAWADPEQLWGGRVEVQQDHRELFFLRRAEHDARGGLIHRWLATGRTEAAALILGLFAAPSPTLTEPKGDGA